jgi:acetyl-CoA acyltransferase
MKKQNLSNFREVVVIGVGAHNCGKFMDVSLKDLGTAAVWKAIRDAGIDPRDLDCAYVGNSLAGAITGQHMVRGQVALRWAGLGGIPVVNVETACASGTLAFREAWIAVASGLFDMSLALGMEKLYCDDTPRSIKAMASASDVDLFTNMGFQYMGMYGSNLRTKMEEFGWSQELFAKIAVKGKYNGSLNPIAQYKKTMTVEEVLSSRVVAWPLTLYMCSTMGDGAAAAILCAKEIAGKYKVKPVTVATNVVRMGKFMDPRIYGQETMQETPTGPSGRNEIAIEAYEETGIGPEDIDLCEIHDAVAPAELETYSGLGLCEPGEEMAYFEEGNTQITGKTPVNTSGGLASRGHPIGATGLLQIYELVLQLRGQAGARQVRGRKNKGPKIALASNGGGVVEGGAGANCITILKV